MGKSELSEDPRFQGNPARIENRTDLTSIIEEWMSSFSTDEEVLEALQKHRVPCGPVLTPNETLSHPHFVERGTIRTVRDPLLGEVQIPGFPFKSSDPLPEDSYFAAALGEHNREVLVEELGKGEEEIEYLESSGVIASKPH